MRRWFPLSAPLLVAATVLGCKAKPREPMAIVVSVFPISDLVARIAGPDATVSVLLPPGQSPVGRPTPPGAADSIAHARLVVSVGIGLDGWVDPLVKPGTRTLRVGDRVPTLTGADGAVDPDVWMDPQRARLAASAIAEEMSRADSSHAKGYRARAALLDASLAALDRDIESRTLGWKGRALAQVPPGAAYFVDRYGVSVSKETGTKSPELDVNPLGDAKTSTYDELVHREAAALERQLR